VASDFLEILERDEKARKRISKLVVADILLDPELKLLLVEKSLQTLATKDDLKDTEERLRAEIKETEERLKSYVDVKFDALNKRIDDLHKITLSTLVTLVIGIVGMVLSKIIQ